MKSVIIIFSIVFFSISLTVNASGKPTHEQVEKLVAAAWKEPPRSIDVTYYRTLKDSTKTEQHFRKIYEESADRMFGTKEELSPDVLIQRERMIQMNIDVASARWKNGHKSKNRIRFDMDRLRIDSVSGNPATNFIGEDGEEGLWPEKKIGPNTPFENTYINVPDQDGDYLRYDISHADNKSITIRKVKGVLRHDINRLMSFTAIPSNLFIKIKLGIKKNGSYEPDYRVIDYRKTPADQKMADIASLKRQLKDENRGRRFRALIELKDLMKDKPAELKEIATSMLDDEEANIREASAWILQSLDADSQ